MRLKIRRLDPTVPLPTYGTDEAAGFDLAAAHWLVGSQSDPTVPTGLFPGIVARSSTPLKRGLMGTVRDSGPSSQHWLVGSRRHPTYGVGVIDPDYSGPNDEVMVQVLL